MDKRMSEALDKHITGNYGEDQYREDVYEESQKELNQNLLKRIRALELSLDDSHKSIERLWKEVNTLIKGLMNHRRGHKV